MQAERIQFFLSCFKTITKNILLSILIALSLSQEKLMNFDIMKYSEVERKLKKAGCFEDDEMNGHPLWYSPITKKYFKMSHHRSQEVAKGTLRSISNDSGVML